jgi:hypothetical protein
MSGRDRALPRFPEWLAVLHLHNIYYTCKPQVVNKKSKAMTLNEIVNAYIRDCRPRATAAMRFYTERPDLNSAILHAALCLTPRGKRADHQRRIRRAVLHQAQVVLQNARDDLKKSEDFETLHKLVAAKIGPIKGIGRLAVYDIALRIGAYLGKHPGLVHLHAGAKTGAASLGFRGDAVHPSVLPPAFSTLSPAEIEDCLCIYKDDLHGAGTTAAPTHAHTCGRPLKPAKGCS